MNPFVSRSMDYGNDCVFYRDERDVGSAIDVFSHRTVSRADLSRAYRRVAAICGGDDVLLCDDVDVRIVLSARIVSKLNVQRISDRRVRRSSATLKVAAKRGNLFVAPAGRFPMKKRDRNVGTKCTLVFARLGTAGGVYYDR